MFKRILVPIENVNTSTKSMDYAIDLAKKYNSELILFNAQEIAPAFLWADETIAMHNFDYDPEKLALQIITDAKAYFESQGITPLLRTSIGDAAYGIIDIAEAENCDLIIMCTHGMKAMKRFLLGSVTTKIVHHAHIPVLVVR